MVDDRRSARRATLSGARVTYESATMDQVEADALNLGSGGLFILTAAPLAVGKRLAIELRVEGESETWSALGRVVWTRGAATGSEPSGMGVKLIDMEDGVIEAIDRLIEARALDEAIPAAAKVEPLAQPPLAPAPAAPVVERPREPVPGAMALGAPARERTLLGVGLTPIAPEMPVPPPPSQRPPPPAPAPSQPAPAAKGNAREPSVVIDLVPDHERATGARNEQTVTSVVPPASRRKGKAGWIVLLMLVVAAAAAYAIWDGDLDRALKTFGLASSETPAAPSPPPPPPLPAVGVTATRGAAPPFTAVLTAASASGYAHPGPAMGAGTPATSVHASSGPTPATSSARPPNAGTASTRKGNEDNPY